MFGEQTGEVEKRITQAISQLSTSTMHLQGLQRGTYKKPDPEILKSIIEKNLQTIKELERVRDVSQKIRKIVNSEL